MVARTIRWGAICGLSLCLLGPTVALSQRIGPRPLLTNQERSFQLDGAENCRDLGGLPVRGGYLKRGMFLRCAELSGLTAAGVEQVRRWGWRTVVDLRRPDERIDSHKNKLPDEYGVGWRFWRPRCLEVSLPMYIVGRDTDMYESYLLDNSKSIRGFFKLLADKNNYPLVVHCACGKDRTGIAVALVLELLGTPRPIIFDDFIYSRNVDWMMVNGDDLQHCFNIIDKRCGGIKPYLRSQGVTDKELDTIPLWLVDKADWQMSSKPTTPGRQTP